MGVELVTHVCKGAPPPRYFSLIPVAVPGGLGIPADSIPFSGALLSRLDSREWVRPVATWVAGCAARRRIESRIDEPQQC